MLAMVEQRKLVLAANTYIASMKHNQLSLNKKTMKTNKEIPTVGDMIRDTHRRVSLKTERQNVKIWKWLNRIVNLIMFLVLFLFFVKECI